jgi:hypothetical protein
MQQKSREKILSKLKKLGMDVEKSLIAQNATDDQLVDFAEGLEKLRDYRLARFLVTLNQSHR